MKKQPNWRAASRMANKVIKEIRDAEWPNCRQFGRQTNKIRR